MSFKWNLRHCFGFVLLCTTDPFGLAIAHSSANFVGRGMSLESGFVSKCIAAKPEFVYLGVDSLVVEGSRESAQNLQTTNSAGELDANMLGGLASGRGAWDFYKQASHQSLELTERISLEMVSGYYSIFENQLSDWSQLLLRESLSTFEKKCGLKYLRSVTLGGSFSLRSKLRFRNRESFERFTREFEIQAFWGLVSNKDSLTTQQQEQFGEIDVEIIPLQRGGSELALAEVTSSEAAVRCQFTKSPTACFEYRRVLFEYAKAELPKQFQIPADAGELEVVLGKFVVLDEEWRDYRIN